MEWTSAAKVLEGLGCVGPEVPVARVDVLGHGPATGDGHPELGGIEAEVDVAVVVVRPVRVGLHPRLVAGVEALVDVDAEVVDEDGREDVALHEVHVGVEVPAGECGDEQLALGRGGVARQEMQAIMVDGPELGEALGIPGQAYPLRLVVVETALPSVPSSKIDQAIKAGDQYRVPGVSAVGVKGAVRVVGVPRQAGDGQVLAGSCRNRPSGRGPGAAG